MNKSIFLCCVFCFSLVGCTSSEQRKQASGGFKYTEVTEGQLLEVPEELDIPPVSNRYALPQTQSEYTLLGPEILVASPRLVLPLVSGTRIEEGSANARVLFEQTNDAKALDKTIWDAVLGYLNLNNIAVESFDEAANELVTDWVVSREEVDTSWYKFSDEVIEQSKKYKLNVEIADHGRTGSLEVSKVAFIDQNGNSQLANISPFELRENEVNFLNAIIAEYDLGIRLAQNQRIEMIRDGFNTELGFNPDGETGFVIDANYSNAWPRLLLVLRKMGFDVIDLDQSSGLMFVQYNGTDGSWWEGWFSDDELSLDNENYRLLVESVGEKTIVTFKDEDNQAFEPKLATEIFPIFAEHMADANLDI